METKDWLLIASVIVTTGCNSMPKPGLPSMELPKMVSSWDAFREGRTAERAPAPRDEAIPGGNHVASELTSLQAQLLRAIPEVRIQACNRLGELVAVEESRLAASELLNNVIQLDPSEDVRAAATVALRRGHLAHVDEARLASVSAQDDVSSHRPSFLRKFWK